MVYEAKEKYIKVNVDLFVGNSGRTPQFMGFSIEPTGSVLGSGKQE